MAESGDSPVRVRPNRTKPGIPRLDSLVDELTLADTATGQRIIERDVLHRGRLFSLERDVATTPKGDHVIRETRGPPRSGRDRAARFAGPSAARDPVPAARRRDVAGVAGGHARRPRGPRRGSARGRPSGARGGDWLSGRVDGAARGLLECAGFLDGVSDPLPGHGPHGSVGEQAGAGSRRGSQPRRPDRRRRGRRHRSGPDRRRQVDRRHPSGCQTPGRGLRSVSGRSARAAEPAARPHA